MIVTSSEFNSWKRDKISSPVVESRFPVGSSARIIEGLFTKVLAMATLCFSPPESSVGL